MRILIITVLGTLLCGVPAIATEHWNVGLTGNGVVITAQSVETGDDTRPTILVIGGLDGNGRSVGDVTGLRRSLEDTPERERPVDLITIPLANPDGVELQFPPDGTAYREQRESHALWRWIGVRAPDLVLVVGDNDYGLAEALSDNAVAGIGRIPALRVPAASLDNIASVLPSEARIAIEDRLERTPAELANELGSVYGQDFDQLTYLPGMALIARMRMGDVDDVDALARPYLSENTLERASSLTLAGHLVFAELADRTGSAEYLELVTRAADLGWDADGNMQESMPFHGEMSDSFFMAGPLLARAGALTGETRYFDMAARHIDFMRTLDLRSDGLYRHSPLSEAAWSRGNAFPALGVALTLSDFPADHPDYARLTGYFRDHMEALAEYQDAEGMWHEVIDYPGAYAEYSSTAMIGTAMLRGIRNGWLDAGDWQPHVDAAWRAILRRTGPDGSLIDVCESTNRQETLDAYLDRAAILGRDVRGGGMAMMFATEMAGMN